MKKVYIDFEMNRPDIRGKRDILNVDIIAIGAIKYDEETGEIEEFKSLIKPIITSKVYPHIENFPNQALKLLITSSYVGALIKSSDVIFVNSSI